MFVLLALFAAATAVAAIAGAISLTVTDGYGRMPQRSYARAI